MHQLYVYQKPHRNAPKVQINGLLDVAVLLLRTVVFGISRTRLVASGAGGSQRTEKQS